MNGAISLDRQILDWRWYTDIRVKCVFIHILLKANFKDNEWQGITIKRGQLVTSIQHIAKESGVSFKSVRTALKKLQKTGELGIQTTNRYTLITVKNYDLYQCEWANKGQTKGKQRANKGQQLNKDNKDNKDKDIVALQARDEIITYLNQKSGRKFEATAKKAAEKINERLREGYTVEDFKRVIDNKVAEWGKDKRMRTYLRPNTLFSISHFDEYLNQECPSSSDEMDDWLKGGEG